MTFLDAYPLVAFVADEPAAGEVDELLREGGAQVAVVNLCEVVDVCRRVHGVAGADVRGAIEPLYLVGSLVAVTSGEREAWRAAELRAAHYDRRRRALSLADCLLLAHALESGDDVATADPVLAEVARAEGTTIVPLPDSTGKRPQLGAQSSSKSSGPRDRSV